MTVAMKMDLRACLTVAACFPSVFCFSCMCVINACRVIEAQGQARVIGWGLCKSSALFT